jgi:hypothetical protein
MIRLVKRAQLDEEKYNHCISNSFESRIFAFSWYLDIVADIWEVLVYDDYLAVMPLPVRIKYGVKYVYPPFWLIELGIFTIDKSVSQDIFINEVFKYYKFVETRLNYDNVFSSNLNKRQKKEVQVLSLSNNYENIVANYSRNRKRELKKAEEFGLIEKWDDLPELLINLYKRNVGKRVPEIKNKDYDVLLNIMNESIKKGLGELLTIYDSENSLVGATFYLIHNSIVTNLVSTTDFNNRKNGVNTFFNDRAIFKFQSQYECFHFGGSSMKGIADYYKSFGAKTKDYFLLKKRLL